MLRESRIKLSYRLLISGSILIFAGVTIHHLLNGSRYSLNANCVWTAVSILTICFILLAFRKIQQPVKRGRSWVEYEVKSSDTLSEISRRYNTSWKELSKVNKLEAPYDLVVGSMIMVPAAKVGEMERRSIISDTTKVQTDTANIESEREQNENVQFEPINFLKEEDSSETVDEIFGEDDIPQEEIAAELAEKPPAKSKSGSRSKTSSKTKSKSKSGTESKKSDSSKKIVLKSKK